MRHRKLVALLLVHLFGLESSALASLRASGAHLSPAPVREVVLPTAAAAPPPRPVAVSPPAALAPPLAAVAGAPALVAATVALASAGPEPFDLNLWTREGEPANGAWNVAPGGRSVEQLLAGQASFFVSERPEVGTTLSGRLSVGAGGAPHNGGIGFVLGHRAPLAAEGHPPQQTETLLLSWFSEGDPVRTPGLVLARVTGFVADPVAAFRDLADPSVSVLETSQGAGRGWLPERDYAVTLVHRRGRLELLIDGVSRLEAFGDFPAGRFGFFTDAQAAAVFADFTSFVSNQPPAADAGPDLFVEANAGCAAAVTLDGSASQDPDGDALTFTWSGAFGSASGASPVVTLPVGRHSILLSVDDLSGGSASDTLEVLVTDVTPPLLACPADLVLAPHAGACEVAAPGLGQPSASDDCGVVDLVNDAPASFGQGSTLVAWSATDANGLRASCQQRVSVADVVAPSVAASLQTTQLWPPNHELRDVGLDASGLDACGAPPPDLYLQVWSDEPDEDPGSGAPAGGGDGNHPGDADLEDGVLRLRSERQGGGDGRVYLAVVTARDAAGNAGVACLTAVVPKSGSKRQLEVVLEQAAAAVLHCEANPGQAPAGFQLLLDEPLELHNRPPVVSAGPDALLTLPQDTLELQGTVTDDGRPFGTLTTLWSQLDGPDTVVFSDPSLVTSTAQFPEPGSYRLRLRADDGELNASDDVQVVVLPPNQAPQVDAGPDRELDLPATSLTLVGSATDDGQPPGSTLTLLWTQLSGPAPVVFATPGLETTLATFPAAGVYQLRLTASDGELSSSDEVRVTLRQLNQPPVVDAGPDRSLQLPQTSLLLAGTVSDDGLPEPPSLSVAWSQLSGPGPVSFSPPDAATTTASFSVPGSYLLRLTADDTAAVRFDDVSVLVLPANAAPLVDAGPDQALTLPLDTISLDATVSDDGLPPGAPLSFAWSQLAGPAPVQFGTPAAEDTTARFSVPGSYLLRLSVSDSELTGSDDVAVVVNAPPVPTLSVEDVAVVETNGSGASAELRVRLSVPSPDAVSVDYVTADREARTPADFEARFGTLSFAPGETERSVSVPIIGDLLVEGDETFVLLLANESGALLSSPEAIVTVIDDDAANAAPSIPGDLQPPDGSELFVVPTLSWFAGDPDGEPLSFDVYLADALDDGGQRWSTHESPERPLARSRASTGYDAGIDRLVVFGGRTAAGVAADAWVLSDASAAGGAPAWRPLTPAGGAPAAREGAVGDLDPGSGRLIVHGGCSDGCALALADTWVLVGATDPAGTSEWLPLPAAPDGRAFAVGGYDPGTNRLVVFGGTADGVDRDDVWVLRDANGLGAPAWEALAPSGPTPAPRHAAAGAYDAAGSRLLVFGGRDNADRAFDDLWILEHANGLGGVPAWTRLEPPGPRPAARSGHSAHWDPARSRLVVFGGSTTGRADGSHFVFGDAWILALPEDPAQARWLATSPSGAPPHARLHHSAGYEARSGRLVVALGENDRTPPSFLDDVWVLDGAAGRLPLVATDLAAFSFAPVGLVAESRYLWQVVARDPAGATAYSALVRFDLSTPRLDVGDASAAEGDAGASEILFSVSLSGGDQPVSVDYATADGTALAGADYLSTSGTLDFPVGTLARTIAVPVVTDTVPEGDETFRLVLSDPSGAVLARAEATGTILDDDPENQPPTADAGPDQSTTLPADTLTLAGSVSDDGLPVGSLLAASWSTVSGPTAAIFADATSPTTQATFGAPGTYLLRLSADDGELTGSDDVSISVFAPQAPADLVALRVEPSGVSVDAQSLAVSGTLSFEVANLGGVASGPFSILIFEDRDLDGGLSPGDVHLGSTVTPGLDGGVSAFLSAPVSGSLSFAGNLLHVLVDSDDVVPESDETNNVASSAAPCEPAAPGAVGGFDARLEWQWSGSPVAPSSKAVLMTPAVADLDGDGVPDVVFATSAGQDYNNGTLRAISGRDARELFSLGDPASRVYSAGHVAVGDIDGDGRVEIVAVQSANNRLIAFEHDGTLEWTSPLLEPIGQGGPAIADLDEDGTPEIVVGRYALRADGTVLWAGTGGHGRGSSSVADLDLQGGAEVVAGDTAYRADGSILWRASPALINGANGYTAVGNFDADPFPEIVVVTAGTGLGWLYLLEGESGATIWGPVSLPGGGSGAPVVADFDGDGQPEIGVSGLDQYMLFDSDGSLLWQSPIQDGSSFESASSAFDIDLDGAAEVIHRDERHLRIFAGADGQVLFETELNSATLTETPVVADVDGDGQLEILVGGDALFRDAPSGLFLFGGPGPGWPSARGLWNQHSYHITNIEDDGRIPTQEQPSWLGPNSYRSNGPTPGCPVRAADLAPSFVRVERLGAERVLTARIGNSGDSVAVAGIPVAFFDGSPKLGGRLLGTTALGGGGMLQGQFRDVQLVLPLGVTTQQSIWVVADDDGRGHGILTESDETNNAFDSRLALAGPEGVPDLVVTSVDTSGAQLDLATLQLYGAVQARLRNQGESSATGPFEVTFFEDRDGDGLFAPGADSLLATISWPGLDPATDAVVTAPVDAALLFAGSPVFAFVDSADVVAESDEGNNTSRTGSLCRVSPPVGSFTPVVEWAWTGSATLPGSTNVGVAPVVVDLDGDGVSDIVFVTAPGNPASPGGRLRAVRGRDGSELFTVTDPALGVNGLANPAVGDLDGDGRPEIVTMNEARNRLLAFRHDGSLLWQGAFSEARFAQIPAIADLDGDGRAEIALARQVFDANGQLLWTGTGGDGFQGVAQTHIADLDLDGTPEVITGHTAYRADGSVFWQNTAILDTFTAVADVDDDPFPEVIFTAPSSFVASQVTIAEHTGVVRVLSPAIPGIRTSGPTLADFDGDGHVDVAFVNAVQLAVLNRSGDRIWTRPVQHSNGVGGVLGAPVAFDFDADGAAELVHGDETGLRIYDGRTGAVLGQVDLGSCDGLRTPVVADVDGDGNAEIVVSVDRSCGPGAPAGIYVIGDERDHWVGTRPVWNQTSYHVTNVEDDGGVPVRELNNWPSLNSFRQQSLIAGLSTLSPDLTASFVRTRSVGSDVAFTARIGNAGATVAGSGLAVSFYDGDPRAGGVLLGTTSVLGALAPGGFEDVDLTLPDDTPSDAPVWVAADDVGDGSGRVSECDEENNLVDSGAFLNQAPTVDAGPDRTLTPPATSVLLTGSVSDDGLPTGSTVTASWTLASGPGAVVFGDPSSPVTQATLSTPGTYILRLTGSDGLREASDDVQVVVTPPNQPPLVNAGPDQSITRPPLSSVVLAGSASDDGLPLPGVLAVSWSAPVVPAGGGVVFSDPQSLATTATFSSAGLYTLELLADDGEAQTADRLDVLVTAGNTPPVVEAGPDQLRSLPTLIASLVGSVTDDGLPGSALSVLWTVLSGPGPVVFDDPRAPATTARFETAGTYLLRLAADDTTATVEDQVRVVIQGLAPVGAAPFVELIAPASGLPLTTFADVTGTVRSDSLVIWSLAHRLRPDGAWTVFATGDSEVEAAVLGVFDPTLLLNGQFDIRLRATDLAARTAQAVTTVVVRDNLKVGNFTLSFVDLEVPVSGLPIRITRTYDSREKRQRDFGVGWSLDIASVRVQESGIAGLGWQGTSTGGAFASYCLDATRPHVVTVTMPDGRVHEFDMKVTPSCQSFVPIREVRVGFQARPGSLGTLVPQNPRAIVASSWPGPAELFDATSFRSLDPVVYQYTSPDGRAFVIHEADGLQTLRDLNGNVLTVTRNGVEHSSGRGVAFQRDAQGRITAIVDPEGEAMRYSYDLPGDLVAYTDREQSISRYGYQGDHRLEDIEDPRGITPIRNEYDAGGRLIAHTDAFGKRIEYTHDIGVRQEVIRDRLLQVRVLDYDERGNVLRETQPDGRVILRSFDARNNRLSETEPHQPGTPDPPTTLFSYDANDNLLSSTDPLGNTTSQTYDALQRVLTSTDARDNTTTNSYDARGNLLSTTDAAEGATSFSYDAAGNVLTQTDAASEQTEFRYDGFGNLLTEIDADGNQTSHTYDASGNRLSSTTTRTTPAGPQTLTTRFSYDRMGRLVASEDPDGTTTRAEYDALGKQIRSIDKLNRTTEFEYDEMGRLVRTTFPDLTTEESGYDDEGRRTSSTDRNGRISRFEYDSLGRLVKTTFPDLSFTENGYDEAGRLVLTRDARGNPTRFEYDAAGRRSKVIDALSQETAFGYDANGNQTSVLDPRGRTTRFEYDALNRRVKTIFPDLTELVTGYDELGRRVSETDQANRQTRFEYDGLGRLVKVIDALLQETSYGYDEQGNRIRQTDANAHSTLFEYDELGRQVRRTLPGGAFERMSYDAAGNLASRTDFNGVTTTYSYDVANRLLRRVYPDSSEVAFTYTPMGNRETATDSRGTTSYTYDNRDRLESLTYPDGRKLTYGYDANGNRTSLTAEVGGQTLTTTYAYDELNRLQTVTDSEGRDYVHEYDRNGNRSKLTYPNNTETSYVYDDLNRLTNLTTINTATSGMIQSYQYTLGAAGNRERIDEHDGTARAYTYDDLYRLEKETVSDSVGLVYEKSFVYDPVGNRESQTTVGSGAPGTPLAPGTIDYTYDDRDRILTEGTQPYSWDESGNLVTKDGEASYFWDFENRLTRVEKTDGTTVTHAYDADGNKVRTATSRSAGSPEVTEFLVDNAAAFSHVVVESDGSGNVKAHYVRGDELLGVVRPSGSRFFHADGLGSIRRLTDEAGVLTDGYSYDAFGELLAHTGPDTQPYAYAGEPLDLVTGFQYHRARWMDPSTGRFVGIDPWPGSPFDPAELHRYLYAGLNAPNRVDPSGLFTLTTQMVVTTIRVTLFSLNVYNAAVNVVESGLAASKAVQAFRRGDSEDGLGYALYAVLRGGLAALNVAGIKSFINSPPTFSGGLATVSFANGGGSTFLSTLALSNPAVAEWAWSELFPAIVSSIPTFMMGTPSEGRNRVRKGQGPRGVSRIDRGHVPGDQWHAHHGAGEGSPAVNLDGSIRHGKDLSWITNEIRQFLRTYGFNL